MWTGREAAAPASRRPGRASAARGMRVQPRAAPGWAGSARQARGRPLAACGQQRRGLVPGARNRPLRRKPGGGATGRGVRKAAPDGRRILRSARRFQTTGSALALWRSGALALWRSGALALLIRARVNNPIISASHLRTDTPSPVTHRQARLAGGVRRLHGWPARPAAPRQPHLPQRSNPLPSPRAAERIAAPGTRRIMPILSLKARPHHNSSLFRPGCRARAHD